MYQQDVPIIRDWALSSPHKLAGLGVFALATIQQDLKTVPASVKAIAADGEASKYLFGAKRAGYAYLEANATRLFDIVRRGDVQSTVEAFAAVPGLGMVKAGFVAQCLGQEVGCLDRHNVALFGLSERALRLPKTLTAPTRTAKIGAYIAECQKLGGAEFLWDNWCELVAARDGLSPDQVSKLHVLATLDSWPG